MPTPANPNRRIFYGILVSNLVSIVFVGTNKYLTTYLEGNETGNSSGIFIFQAL